jgi:hypothetical protein
MTDMAGTQPWTLTVVYKLLEGGLIQPTYLTLYSGADPALYRVRLDGPPGATVDVIPNDIAQSFGTLSVGNSIDVESTGIYIRCNAGSLTENGIKVWGTYERL